MFCIAILYGGLKQVLLALQMGDGSARGGCVWDGDTTARGATDRRNMVRRVWLAAAPWPLSPLSLGVAWLTCTELHLLLSKPNFTSSKGPQGKSILAMYIPIAKSENRKKHDKETPKKGLCIASGFCPSLFWHRAGNESVPGKANIATRDCNITQTSRPSDPIKKHAVCTARVGKSPQGG
jgi:hypothetical protein